MVAISLLCDGTGIYIYIYLACLIVMFLSTYNSLSLSLSIYLSVSLSFFLSLSGTDGGSVPICTRIHVPSNIISFCGFCLQQYGSIIHRVYLTSLLEFSEKNNYKTA